MTQPPGDGNTTLLNRASNGPVSTTDALIFVANSLSNTLSLSIFDVSIKIVFCSQRVLAPSPNNNFSKFNISVVFGTF